MVEESFEMWPIVVKAETDKALLVDFEDFGAEWLPKSQLQVLAKNEMNQPSRIAIPEWLAKKRGYL